MDIRASTDGDVASIAALFTESVHRVAARSYTPEQLTAWAPRPPDLEQWRARLAPLDTLIAEIEGAMAGFISCAGGGHIELLFTAPAFVRRGVASELYEEAVQRLLAKGVERLSADVSIEARPFFASRGFSVVEEQVVERNGVQLRRFAMARACGGETPHEAT